MADTLARDYDGPDQLGWGQPCERCGGSLVRRFEILQGFHEGCHEAEAEAYGQLKIMEGKIPADPFIVQEPMAVLEMKEPAFFGVKLSEWECDVFGNGVVKITPEIGKVPSAWVRFWSWFFLGTIWRKVDRRA